MWLTIRNGEERGKVIRVEAGRCVIGRDDDCDLTLADSKVSRRHAELERFPDGSTVLRDLGSSNGTYLDGERIESAGLAGRRQIQLGNTVLVASPDEPDGGRAATVFDSVLAIVRSETPSAVYRRVVDRSLRRATALGIAALVVAAGAAATFAAGVLSPGGGATAIERVVKGAAASTVAVESLADGVAVDSGTGWVLDGPRRLIVTDAHVINGGTAFDVGANGATYRATVVGLAPCEDLAVLAVPAAQGLRTLKLGSQSALEQGETVVAVGYPADASQEHHLTSTSGVVSVVRSSYREPTLDVPRYPNVVQTDAAINPGNSGGPLLTLDGKLAGVMSAGRTMAPDGRIIQGQNYAIGVDRVKEITATLRRRVSIGWTGASFEYSSEAELRRQGLPPGLRAGPPVPGTPADRAGLRPGMLITAVNGMKTSTLAEYCDAVAGLPAGAATTFTVLSPGAGARDLTIRLA